ncbi:hypothetical protein ACFWXK_09220 [Streptomyces sp. NPDC059070]|uniref:hypothetical protein n=1 Tax=Streptomyces sp. NPDC059070 TaxID=3346713 RepID=UPI003698C366
MQAKGQEKSSARPEPEAGTPPQADTGVRAGADAETAAEAPSATGAASAAQAVSVAEAGSADEAVSAAGTPSATGALAAAQVASAARAGSADDAVSAAEAASPAEAVSATGTPSATGALATAHVAPAARAASTADAAPAARAASAADAVSAAEAASPAEAAALAWAATEVAAQAVSAADAAPATEAEALARAASEAEELLRDGRLTEARRRTERALFTHGPHPRLYAVLGRAHAAEGDDGHDERAEAAFRDGLDAFPQDVGLLSAYADLCLGADPLEQPDRRRRVPELVARISRLAPGSPQARHAERCAGDEAVPTAAQMQRHDARLLLKLSPTARTAAARARRQAAARPGDERLAVLAETLEALARPGRAALRPLIAHPRAGAPVVLAGYAAVLLAVAALHLPGWSGCAAALPLVPPLSLHRVLRGARRRAASRPAHTPAEAPRDPSFPALPPVPAHTRRERVAGVLALVAAVAVAGSVMWSRVR